jgi:hypothetical protein
MQQLTTQSHTAQVCRSRLWKVEMPVLSTAHITRETNELLLAQGDSVPWMSCAVYDVGYFISVPLDDSHHLCPPPQDLIAIWNWAREHGYQWIRLDAAGDQIDALPSHDW